ncbi:hypothetical protein CLAFUW4_09226 [Fulvia fulva]|uniref:Uncharacterized protein n=1 Tax=Passalora fulva TaxID=5499 RepID=A0A9Q8PFC9_PASFU|nr:uncharacterized protein CLAFUR5_09327 [Fulvia fulva]KAK4613835.1 hypothetical protein CLAFUR4_09232 [Fulvia fulva]KAK4614523.1 hypothetical protein CLAFUR0_09224 [Fulvia fulva]UJO21471.1 hypothetical protein CLAFUR5_09327 [Fulvia fulva]WPV20578.1 hypothetical protein CLAFUW4_09226 [Fulvia fulva]WPV34941.1 hypothetical protein CLAFUW7_09227 [Fulvia fulva]
MSSCYRDSITGDTYCDNDTWNDWARWVVLAAIIIVAFLLFFSFSCVSARRRRRFGAQPYRGTGWALGRTPAGHNAPTYNSQPYYAQHANQYQQPQPYYNNSHNPPPYTPPPNNGYYGQNDVELQQPQQAYGGYRSGEAPAYEPPKGAPPGRV